MTSNPSFMTCIDFEEGLEIDPDAPLSAHSVATSELPILIRTEAGTAPCDPVRRSLWFQALRAWAFLASGLGPGELGTHLARTSEKGPQLTDGTR